MRTPAYVVALLFASVEKEVKAQCYEEEGGEPIADCTCHESCGTCGYNYDPSYYWECITCAEGQGLELYPEYEDGTGECRVPGVQACYEYEGDTETIPDCECDNTCGTGCGYYDEPNGSYDCIDCIDGLVLYDLYIDGTGRCREPGAEACYENVSDDTPIEGCMCHESCGTSCAGLLYEDLSDIGEGVFEQWPDYEENCVDCVDGLELFPVWEDGTGYCLEPSICYDPDTFEPTETCTCEDNCQECLGDESLGTQNCGVCKNPYGEYYIEDYNDETGTFACPDITMD